MSEKLVAGIVTTAGRAPLCAVCVLGPAAIGSMVAGMFGWIGGAGPLPTVALMAAAGLLAYRTLRPRHGQNMTCVDHQRFPSLPTEGDGKLRLSEVSSSIRSAKKGERS